MTKTFKKRSLLFEELVIKSWWTILFSLLCYFAYDEGMRRRGIEEKGLREKLTDLYAAQTKAKRLQEDLRLQLESQNDSAWIELVLMRRLGLVPEGEQKVCFIEE